MRTIPFASIQFFKRARVLRLALRRAKPPIRAAIRGVAIGCLWRDVHELHLAQWLGHRIDSGEGYVLRPLPTREM